MATEPLRISGRTHRLIRLGATMNEITMGAFVDAAVAEFLARHADEIDAGFVHARAVLGLTPGAANSQEAPS